MFNRYNKFIFIILILIHNLVCEEVSMYNPVNTHNINGNVHWWDSIDHTWKNENGELAEPTCIYYDYITRIDESMDKLSQISFQEYDIPCHPHCRYWASRASP